MFIKRIVLMLLLALPAHGADVIIRPVFHARPVGSGPGSAGNAFRHTRATAGVIYNNANAAYMSSMNHFTLSFWMKTTETENSGYIRTCPNGAANGFTLENQGYAGRLSFYCSHPSGWHVSPSTNLADGAWHFVAITGSTNNNSLLFYVDGLAETPSPSGFIGIPASSGTYIYTGYGYAATRWGGTIDEVCMWSRALSSNEVWTMWNGGAGVYGDTNNAPWNDSLVLGWHLDESGTNTSVHDFSATADDAATVNETHWDAGKVLLP